MQFFTKGYQETISGRERSPRAGRGGLSPRGGRRAGPGGGGAGALTPALVPTLLLKRGFATALPPYPPSDAPWQ